MDIKVDDKTFKLIKDEINDIPVYMDEPKVKDPFGYRVLSPSTYDSHLLLNIDEKTELVLTYIKPTPYSHSNKLVGLRVNNLDSATLVNMVEDKNRKVITDELIKKVLFSNIIILLGEYTADIFTTIDKLDFYFLLLDNNKRVELVNTLLKDLDVSTNVVKVEKINVTGYKESEVMNRIDKLTINATFNYKNVFIDVDMEWNIGNNRSYGYLSIDGKYLNKNTILGILLDKIIKGKDKG